MTSLDELRRQALEDGDELVIDGRVFNAERVKTRLAPVPKPTAAVSAPPAPLPPPPAVLPSEPSAPVREEAPAPVLQTQALVDTLSRAFASVQAAPQPHAERPSRWKLKVSYDRSGRIDDIDMTPVYE